MRAVVGRLDDDAVDAAAEGLDPLRRERILAAAGQRKRSRWVLLAAPAGLAAATILVALAVSALTQRTTTVMEPQQVLIAAGDVEARNEAWEGGLEPSDVTSPTPPGLREPVDARPPAPPSGPTTPVGWERPEPVIRDAEISDHVETDNDLPFEETLGEDGLSDAPFTGPANNGLIGLGGAAGGAFHGRGGARELRRFEGSGGYVEPDATPPPPSYGTEALRRDPGQPLPPRRRQGHLHLLHRRGHRVVRQRAPLPRPAGAAAAAGRGAHRGAGQLLPLRLPAAGRGRRAPVRRARRGRGLPVGAGAPAGARSALKGKVLQQAERPAAQPRLPARRLRLDEPRRTSCRSSSRRCSCSSTSSTARDRVAIVVYAGAAGPRPRASTAGDEQAEILAALDAPAEPAAPRTAARASSSPTDVAQENFVEGGVNRVILCTDGDFNVGVSDQRRRSRS